MLVFAVPTAGLVKTQELLTPFTSIGNLQGAFRIVIVQPKDSADCKVPKQLFHHHSLFRARATEWEWNIHYQQLDDWTAVQRTTQKRERLRRCVKTRSTSSSSSSSSSSGPSTLLFKPTIPQLFYSDNPRSLLVRFLDFDGLFLNALLYLPTFRLVH